MQGILFFKINKRADQNKAMQGDSFFSELINVHAPLFGTLEWMNCLRGDPVLIIIPVLS